MVSKKQLIAELALKLNRIIVSQKTFSIVAHAIQPLICFDNPGQNGR